MAYWLFSTYDRQSRRAIGAAGMSEYASAILPQLSGKDTFFRGPGQGPNYDFPNPSFAVQSRAAYQVARLSQDESQVSQFALVLLGKDKFFRGPGVGAVYDEPNPSFAVPARAAARVAQLAQDESQVSQFALVLIGKDAFFRGSGIGAVYDEPNPSFAVVKRQAYIAASAQDQLDTGNALNAAPGLPPGEQSQDLPPIAPARARADVYTIGATFPPTLIGQDALNTGEQSQDLPVPAAPRRLAALEPGVNALALTAPPVGQSTEPTALPAKAPARAREYGQTYGFPLVLIGKDQLATGEASQDLPPRAVARAREYGETAGFPLTLIGQDAVNVGEQSQDLPPRGPARSRDYTWLQQFQLDVYEQIPVGGSTAATELPPRAPLRAREYGQASAFPLTLIGQDATNTGARSQDLPVPAAPRRQPALEPGVQALPLLNTVVPPPPGAQAQDLPPRAALRAREYGQTASFPLELIGQDKLNAGARSYDLPTPAAPRIRSAFEPGVIGLALTAPPIGAQSQDLPPRAALRARPDVYGIAAAFPLVLIGQDAVNVGEQSQDLPPRAPARTQTAFEPGFQSFAVAVTPNPIPYGAQITALPYPPAPLRARPDVYSFTATFPKTLVGKDAVNAGKSTELTALPPKGPARARDYTFVASFPLELIGKDKLNAGASTERTVLPPRGPARSRDYTFTFSVFLGLLGKDAVNPGEQSFDLPPRAAARTQTAFEPGSQPLVLVVTPPAPPAPPAEEVEQPKFGERFRRVRTERFRRQLRPSFVSASLQGPRPSLRANASVTYQPRYVTGWLVARPQFQALTHVLNLRHVSASVQAPQPIVGTCQQIAGANCPTAATRAAGPSLKATASVGIAPSQIVEEAFTLSLLFSESDRAWRAWDAEETKRLSTLQRKLNAQVAQTDRQQHRLVQASVPHIRHAFTVMRDAALVALPHAAKANVDPQQVLDTQGYQDGVALLIQAITDLQEAGVTLGFTDLSASFDLQNPYVAAIISSLATRVTDINSTTEQGIRDVIAQGFSEGWSVAEMGTAIQGLAAFSESRALTIAATESRTALNMGVVAAAQDMGATHVLIADGDYDEICADLDGTVQTVDWLSENALGHPNCRRAATPLPDEIPSEE